MVNETIIIERNGTTITCEASGYPPPTIVWSRLDGNLSDRVLVSDNVSVPTGYGNVTRVSVNLTITNASREDTGEYMCSANNSIGSEERDVSITVQCKFLNQAHAGCELACAWFLEITFMRANVCVCVCPPPGHK